MDNHWRRSLNYGPIQTSSANQIGIADFEGDGKTGGIPGQKKPPKVSRRGFEVGF